MAINKHTTVYVGLSGGVDSSVSAALLKEQGYTVVGVFIRTWQPDFIECTWRDERRDAMRVAAHLDIPFRELDLEKEYKKYVANYMIEGYRKGKTPNPDIMCNREIKFGAFQKWAREQGADYIATGHYAQIIEKKGEYVLKMGKDSNKDQTYFLWTLTQDDLAHTLFPVGHLVKDDVRKLATRFGLPTAAKKDSQGICMLGAIDLKDFLKEFIETKEGSVVDEKGTVIGVHPGSIFFTLGERHGFTITHKAYIGGVYYVIAKDVAQNTITVSTDPIHSDIAQEKIFCTLENVNWVGATPRVGDVMEARTRYRAPLQQCEIVLQEKNKIVVRFEKADLTASAGQSLVFYAGDHCLGGGIIA